MYRVLFTSILYIHSLTTKKQTTNFCLQNFKIKKSSSKPYHIQNSNTRGQTVYIWIRWLIMAHYEPSHQDLH